MTDDQERLKVAREIKDAYIVVDDDITDDMEEEVCAILSRRDSLMKKRGAVEELSKMERIVGKDLWSYQLKARVAVGKEIMKRIEELEREIKEMEGSE